MPRHRVKKKHGTLRRLQTVLINNRVECLKEVVREMASRWPRECPVTGIMNSLLLAYEGWGKRPFMAKVIFCCGHSSGHLYSAPTLTVGEPRCTMLFSDSVRNKSSLYPLFLQHIPYPSPGFPTPCFGQICLRYPWVTTAPGSEGMAEWPNMAYLQMPSSHIVVNTQDKSDNQLSNSG